jgi:hypothetical protein
MEKVEVVIKIPKDEYNCIRNGQKTFNTELYLLNAVNAGTVLPKGHGRLFDMGLHRRDDRVISDLLYKLRNEITMLPTFNREFVIEIIDKYLKEVSDGNC